jgi:hypothetical protein
LLHTVLLSHGLLTHVGCCAWSTTNIHPSATWSVPTPNGCTQLDLHIIPHCPAALLRCPDQHITVLDPTMVLSPENKLSHTTVLNPAPTLHHLDPPSVRCPHDTGFKR